MNLARTRVVHPKMNPDLFQQFLQFQQFQQWAYAQQQQQLQSQQQSSVRQVPASGQTQETFAAARVQERVSGQTQTPQQWIQARPNIATEKYILLFTSAFGRF